jgi:hypothetical protein
MECMLRKATISQTHLLQLIIHLPLQLAKNIVNYLPSLVPNTWVTPENVCWVKFPFYFQQPGIVIAPESLLKVRLAWIRLRIPSTKQVYNYYVVPTSLIYAPISGASFRKASTHTLVSSARLVACPTASNGFHLTPTTVDISKLQDE